MDNTVSLLPSYTDLCSCSWQQSRDILYQKATTNLEAKRTEFDIYECSYTLRQDLYFCRGDSPSPLHQMLNICVKQSIQIHKRVFIYHTTSTRKKISPTTDTCHMWSLILLPPIQFVIEDTLWFYCVIAFARDQKTVWLSSPILNIKPMLSQPARKAIYWVHSYTASV